MNEYMAYRLLRALVISIDYSTWQMLEVFLEHFYTFSTGER